MKHTPGPWHVYEGGNFVKIGAVGYDEYVKKSHYLAGPFCVGEAEHNATENYAPDHDRAMANARLIAAAPELLEACKDAMEWLNVWLPHLQGPTEEKLSNTLRAAIAKAEGRGK